MTEHLNEILIIGLVTATPEESELPSGDRVVHLRVSVNRPASSNTKTAVDIVDCVAHTPATRHIASGLNGGDTVRVEGALRRRFWRAGSGASSRTEVEVFALVRL